MVLEGQAKIKQMDTFFFFLRFDCWFGETSLHPVSVEFVTTGLRDPRSCRLYALLRTIYF